MPPARSAFSIEFAARIQLARENAKLTQEEMAQKLTRAAGYEVKADTYRKYEGGAKPSFMPHDLLFYFAEFAGTTVGALVAPLPKHYVIPFPKTDDAKERRGRVDKSRNDPY